MNNWKYAANLSQSTRRGPSGAIWSSCPVDDFQQQPDLGMYFFDDFMMSGNADMTSAYKNSIGQWSVYGAAGAQVNDAAIEGGGIKIGSDGDQEGITLQSSSGSIRLVTTSTLALNGKCWFECRVGRSSVATIKGDMFVGLMSTSLTSGLPTAALPITTTDDTLSTTPSFIGFHSTSSTATRGGPTEWALAFNLASGTVNYPTNLTTLVASAGATALTAGDYVKLGFLFDPFAYPKLVSSATARQTVGTVVKPLIRVFVNGLELPTFLSSADVQNATSAQAFPTAFMTPVIAEMNTTGSTPPTLNADWIGVAQVANS